MKRFFCLADSPSANVSNFGRTPLYDAVYIIAMMLLATSCIYDAPGDKFYRTLWVSEDITFGNNSEVGGCGLSRSFDATSLDEAGTCDSHLNLGKLTIEFLCGGSISVTSTGAVGSYGTYTSDDHTAHFSDLRLHYPEGPDNAPVVIILEEAHRTGDELVVIWHHSDSSTSYTTRLVRKGSYE